MGSCLEFNAYRERWINSPNYFGMSEPWLSLHSEYRSLLAGAVAVTVPIHNVCGEGGGDVSPEDDVKIVNYLDMAQNRMYQLLLQAKASQ